MLIKGGASAAMTVSLPGYDVTTADITQTCFDSRWSGLVPYLRGTIDDINDGGATVSFGETLAEIPLFIGHFKTLSGGVPTTTYANTCTMFRGNGTDQWWYAEVGTSYLKFRAKFGSQASRLYYTLFKRPAG
ncbi:hypothetical protein [Bradyrhizobium sp. STM 3561]|uniref:hypothetical protein n=1 Tax=Bradyrhizobium sp. STM 3561 TaxID=578923 RepID=UPI00388E95C2